MAPDKTDPENGEDTPNTSAVSVDNNTSGVSEGEREPYFEPVVHLPEVQVKTNEEEEEEMLRLRCKLFRYHNQEIPAEWKERGTGDVKILYHPKRNTVRLVMRQDKTLKIRANHYITPYMELKPNCNSDRAFVWSARADFADEEAKAETFAIRFANVDHARLFKDKFDEARGIVTVALVKKDAKPEGKEGATSNQEKKERETPPESSSLGDKDAREKSTNVTEEELSKEVSKALDSLSMTEKETPLKDDADSKQ